MWKEIITEDQLLELIDKAFFTLKKSGLIDKAKNYDPLLEDSDIKADIAISVLEHIRKFDPNRVIKHVKDGNMYKLIERIVLQKIKEVPTRYIHYGAKTIERTISTPEGTIKISEREYYRKRKLFKNFDKISTRNVISITEIEENSFEDNKRGFFERYNPENFETELPYVESPEEILMKKEETKKNSSYKSILNEIYNLLQRR